MARAAVKVEPGVVVPLTTLVIFVPTAMPGPVRTWLVARVPATTVPDNVVPIIEPKMAAPRTVELETLVALNGAFGKACGTPMR